MKKRCTNPSCRKLFVANVMCPHCGKKYPRLQRIQRNVGLFDVQLVSCGFRKYPAFSVLYRHFNMSVGEAKGQVDACPTVVATGVPQEEANRLASLLEETGATVKVRRIS